jgi:hypothetical protein
MPDVQLLQANAKSLLKSPLMAYPTVRTRL